MDFFWHLKNKSVYDLNKRHIFEISAKLKIENLKDYIQVREKQNIFQFFKKNFETYLICALDTVIDYSIHSSDCRASDNLLLKIFNLESNRRLRITQMFKADSVNVDELFEHLISVIHFEENQISSIDDYLRYAIINIELTFFRETK